MISFFILRNAAAVHRKPQQQVRRDSDNTLSETFDCRINYIDLILAETCVIHRKSDCMATFYVSSTDGACGIPGTLVPSRGICSALTHRRKCHLQSKTTPPSIMKFVWNLSSKYWPTSNQLSVQDQRLKCNSHRQQKVQKFIHINSANTNSTKTKKLKNRKTTPASL